MNKLHTYYDNLKVSRTAPLEVIRAAYKILAQKYHPDRNSNNPEAARIMKLINEAYEVLSNPIKRAEHDSWIEAQEEKIRKIQDRNSNKIKNEQNSVDSRSTLTGNKKEILKGFSWLFFITLMGIFVLFLLPEVFSKFSSENEHNYTQNYSSVDRFCCTKI
ncbi:J domain-containing protein [Acinetobacter haemolyticus]|uniref:J domain-containing protein n=1 Tax=Acinetobacter haemolyticus TaxID=29430 RepID=UPI001D18B573|nr:J domain-containing protein [Acinetobacter haemolyticus]